MTTDLNDTMKNTQADVAEGVDPADGDEPTAAEALGVMGDVPTPGSAARDSKTGKLRIKWYRCKVPREELKALNQRSDLWGALQTVGFLAVLAASASLAIYSWANWPWYVTVLLVFINGHFWHFLVNGFHELIHDSVFKTRWLNGLFLRVFAFLGWYNHHWFWASHTEHHKYTLHQPDDLEVVLPQQYSIKGLLTYGIVNVKYPYETLKRWIKVSLGKLSGDQWTQKLFPESEPERRREYFNWARIVVVGHLLIAGVSIAMGWWIVPFVITFPMVFGGWLHTLCNASQHAGLTDAVPDYRLCCRTLYLNPFLQFLYWHMNYHTEHHMYAAVPCYNLPRLHRLIKHDMPECPRGLLATWREIFDTLRKQKQDPSYQFIARLPDTANPSPAAIANA